MGEVKRLLFLGSFVLCVGHFTAQDRRIAATDNILIVNDEEGSAAYNFLRSERALLIESVALLLTPELGALSNDDKRGLPPAAAYFTSPALLVRFSGSIDGQNATAMTQRRREVVAVLEDLTNRSFFFPDSQEGGTYKRSNLAYVRPSRAARVPSVVANAVSAAFGMAHSSSLGSEMHELWCLHGLSDLSFPTAQKDIRIQRQGNTERATAGERWNALAMRAVRQKSRQRLDGKGENTWAASVVLTRRARGLVAPLQLAEFPPATPPTPTTHHGAPPWSSLPPQVPPFIPPTPPSTSPVLRIEGAKHRVLSVGGLHQQIRFEWRAQLLNHVANEGAASLFGLDAGLNGRRWDAANDRSGGAVELLFLVLLPETAYLDLDELRRRTDFALSFAACAPEATGAAAGMRFSPRAHFLYAGGGSGSGGTGLVDITSGESFVDIELPASHGQQHAVALHAIFDYRKREEAYNATAGALERGSWCLGITLPYHLRYPRPWRRKRSDGTDKEGSSIEAAAAIPPPLIFTMDRNSNRRETPEGGAPSSLWRLAEAPLEELLVDTCPAEGCSEDTRSSTGNEATYSRITAGPACEGLLSSLVFGCNAQRAAAHERAARACFEGPSNSQTAPRPCVQAHHHRASCVAQDVLLDFPRGDGSRTALVVAVTALVHCSGLVFVALPWIRCVFVRRKQPALY